MEVSNQSLAFPGAHAPQFSLKDPWDARSFNVPRDDRNVNARGAHNHSAQYDAQEGSLAIVDMAPLEQREAMVPEMYTIIPKRRTRWAHSRKLRLDSGVDKRYRSRVLGNRTYHIKEEPVFEKVVQETLEYYRWCVPLFRQPLRSPGAQIS